MAKSKSKTKPPRPERVDPEYLNVADLAKLFGVANVTILRHLPHMRTVRFGRRVLVRKAEYTLEKKGQWDALGMRGTCSPPFKMTSEGQGDQVLAALSNAPHPLLVEANYSGQLGRLLRAETGLTFPDRFLKYDGEPFYPQEIVGKAMEVLQHGR